MNPHVEILLASYNGERFIAEQIESILKQTYQNFTLIIRDDLSNDRTWDIIKEFEAKYPNKIRVLDKDVSLGSQGNFSALMELSHADYVMLADQDDIWHLDKIKKSLKKMLELEELYSKSTPLLVHTDLTVVNDRVELIHPSFWHFTNIDPMHTQKLNRLLVQNVITGCTCILNRSLLNLALPIPLETVMHDWWLGLVASGLGFVGVINESTINYRQHSQNVLGAKKFGTLTFIRQGIKKLKRPDEKKFIQAQIYRSRYQDLLNDQNKQIVSTYLNIAENHFLLSRYKIVKHHFFKQGFLRNAATFLFQKIP